jgi:hypothetical protein
MPFEDEISPMRAICMDAADVRARRADALRSGNPQWLWPDIQVPDWQDAFRSIGHAVHWIITGGHVELSLAGDCRALGLACYNSGTGPLLGYWHETGKLSAPAEIGSLLSDHLHHNKLRMQKMRTRAQFVAGALRSAGVRLVILKKITQHSPISPRPGRDRFRTSTC